jgi:hypothetical protein
MSIKQANDISHKLAKTVKTAYPMVDEFEVREEPASNSTRDSGLKKNHNT